MRMFNMLRAMDAFVSRQDGGGAVESDIELCQCCLDAGEMTMLASTECGQCGARICDGCLENGMCCECRAQRERDAVTCHTCAFAVGDSVRRRGEVGKVGVIVQLIPAVDYPYYAAHPAKARVRWPDRTRIGGNGYSHSTINLSALVKDEPAPAVTCHKCGAPVESDALARQTMADGTLMWPQPFCRACLLAGLKRLDAELRQPGKDGE